VLHRLTSDHHWADRLRSPAVGIGLATFAILALELALIRWISGQVRIFAYFNNLTLIGAFLGMGLGVAAGRARPGLVHLCLPSLAVLTAVFAGAEPLGLMHLQFPDPSIHMWGAEGEGSGLVLVRNLAIFGALFAGLVWVFVCAGSAVGYLFPKIPVLRAYSWDLLGSLLGIGAFTALTFSSLSPPTWFLLGGLPLLWISRRTTSALALAATVGLTAVSVDGATFSPYNRIDLVPDGGSIRLSVNRDFHQFMHDLSDRSLHEPGLDAETRARRRQYRDAYDLPFVINDVRERALVVGAGTGNDVQAALRGGYGEILSVDIDPAIIKLGRHLHPEQPYDDGRVVPVVNDARAFFEQYEGEPFDAVVYGLLDSHAMFTSLSSLRLDNYVYTEQGIRAAWQHVAANGHLSLSFSVFGGEWMADRMRWTIERATGQDPAVICHNMHFGCTYLVGKPEASLHMERIPAQFQRLGLVTPAAAVRTTSDDWPFLYIRPGIFPWGYLLVLLGVLGLAMAATPLAFGRGAISSEFDPVLFFMGAGFLLIETRGVTSLSLLFGSTWMVNSAIFAGILLMVLLANLAVERWQLRDLGPWAVGLFLSLLLLWWADPGQLNTLPLLARGAVGGLVTGLPIGFAGVIVSILLSRAASPAAALGSNLLGSVFGGCLEYLSMVIGLKALVLLAMSLYLLAMLFHHRRTGAEDPIPGAGAAPGSPG